MTTLSEVLTTARRYWEAKGASSRMMPIRAEKCAEMLRGDRLQGLGKGWGRPQDMGPISATFLLTELASSGLSKASQASYYAAFRRALALSGISTVGWPKGPTPSRRVREALSGEDVRRLQDYLALNGAPETDALIAVLMVTGMRVAVEALKADAVVGLERSIRVTGKGGHERVIPVRDTAMVLEMLGRARKVPYNTHLKRWSKAVTSLGIDSKLPTPHAIRHLFATEAYRRSGKNIRVVQELLGHADPGTTARYIGVDMQELRDAIDG